MKYTSAEANKLLRTLEMKATELKRKEQKAKTFNAASTEDPEALRPEYDFAAVQEKLDDLESKIRTVKHAINVFNTTQTLPGFDDITIDQALVMLPQLSGRLAKYQEMAGALPRERVANYRTNIIDYVITNYDIGEAETACDALRQRITELQLALDMVNNTEKMEIDVSLA